MLSNNEFTHIGQSGIMLVGNNTISYIGDILASAVGGIYGSSVSDSIFIFNNISYVSRWGIAVRSNNNNSMSYRNYLSYNIINYVGLKTSDFWWNFFNRRWLSQEQLFNIIALKTQ